jgi:protoporphyrinogen oxidase
LSSALDFLRFPPLSLIDKARLAATIVAAAQIRNGAAMEEETAVDWLTRWSGRRTVEQIWLPLLRSKLGANAERASAAFIWAIIQRMYGARSSSNKQEAMGYVLGGYDTIVKSLIAGVTRGGLELRSSARVRTVTTTASGATVTLDSGEVLTCDDVVMTIPCGAIASVCPGLREEESARLRRVTYQGVICPSYLLRRPLKGFYVTNITDPSIPFTGVIETTALVDHRSLGGHLVYLPRYLAQDDPRWHDDDALVADECFAALQRMIPGLSADDVIARRVARARDVLAVSTLRYSTELKPLLRTSQPRLFVVNSAQIAHGTLNVDETVHLAERSARELQGLVGADGPPATRIDSPAVQRRAHV